MDKAELIKRLPLYYRKSAVVGAAYEPCANVLSDMLERIRQQERDLFILTTADTSPHEQDVGLDPVNDSTEAKRSAVLAKLRGSATTTAQELKRLVELYDGAAVEIAEAFEAYTVKITFAGHKGYPYNLEQIKAAVNEVIPAHIKVVYSYTPNIWGAVRDRIGSWENVRSYTWGRILEHDERTWMFVSSLEDVYIQEVDANAYLAMEEETPYAKRMEGKQV